MRYTTNKLVIESPTGNWSLVRFSITNFLLFGDRIKPGTDDIKF